jgi:hypothetical protein
MNRSKDRKNNQRLRKLKKKVYKLNYLNEELEDTLLTIDEYSQEFSEALTKWFTQNDAKDAMSEMFPIITEEDILSKIDLDKELEVENKAVNIDPWAKDIYRQIVNDTHPDKVSQRDDISQKDRDKKNAAFIESRHYLDCNDGPSLYVLAIELGLKMTNIPDDILEYFDKSIKAIQDNINKNQGSNAWLWGESSLHNRAKFIENINKKYNIESNESEIVHFLNDYTY